MDVRRKQPHQVIAETCGFGVGIPGAKYYAFKYFCKLKWIVFYL